jgi:GH18 family chitinase
MENPAEIRAKAHYITSRGLAGASVWDLSGDSGNTLTAALTAGLGGH